MVQILMGLLRVRGEYCEVEAGHIMQIVASLSIGAGTSRMQCAKILVSDFACQQNSMRILCASASLGSSFVGERGSDLSRDCLIAMIAPSASETPAFPVRAV